MTAAFSSLILGAVFAALTGAAVGGCAQGGVRNPDSGAVFRDAGRDAGQPRPDAGRDAGQPMVDAGVDAGEPDAGSGPPCTPAEADLWIVEVMISSVTGRGDEGEWFEVENRGACEAQLAGLVIRSPTSTGIAVDHTVTSGVIPPDTRFVFAQSDDPDFNHALDYDYAYGNGTTGVVLNNGDDYLALVWEGTEIERVTWGAGDYATGQSTQFPENALGSNDDLGVRWCVTSAASIYSTAGGTFYGTPGSANEAFCP